MTIRDTLDKVVNEDMYAVTHTLPDKELSENWVMRIDTKWSGINEHQRRELELSGCVFYGTDPTSENALLYKDMTPDQRLVAAHRACAFALLLLKEETR